MGLEQSRRDDLESLMYVIIFLLTGSLPWCGYQAMSRQEKYIYIKDTKMQITPSELCKGLPQEIQELTQYVRNLGFVEKPKYNWMIDQLKSCIKRYEGTLGRISIQSIPGEEKRRDEKDE